MTIPWRDRFFEDFAVGDECRHRSARSVTEYDNLLFTLLTQNPAPLHLDHHYAQSLGHEKRPMNSTLTLALITGQSVADLTPNVMTNLGWSDVRLPAAAFEGDTLYSESRIESLRPSAKREDVRRGRHPHDRLHAGWLHRHRVHAHRSHVSPRARSPFRTADASTHRSRRSQLRRRLSPDCPDKVSAGKQQFRFDLFLTFAGVDWAVAKPTPIDATGTPVALKTGTA